MSNKPVVKALTQLLADSYVLYTKTQNYHWNVTGAQFSSLHALFEAQYTDLAAAIDEIAERIRALGEIAPGKYSSYAKITTIKEGKETATATAMVKDLASDQRKLVTSLHKLIVASQKAGDESTADLAIERTTIHEKNAWMLDSSL